MNDREPHPAFATTQWTLVDRLNNGPVADRQAALAELSRIYWSAVYVFLRRRGLAINDAEETTQGFFAEVVLARGVFERADPTLGRLRSLLLTALKNYQTDQSRRVRARGRGRVSSLPEVLDIEEQQLTRLGVESPERAFDRRWALAQLDEAIRRCRDQFVSRGKKAHWDLFEARTLTPAGSLADAPPLDRIAPVHGFANAAAGAAAIQYVRKQFEGVLRQVFAEAGTPSTELDAEIEHLTELLAP